jgi:hypothetical protein
LLVSSAWSLPHGSNETRYGKARRSGPIARCALIRCGSPKHPIGTNSRRRLQYDVFSACFASSPVAPIRLSPVFRAKNPPA